MQKFDSLTRRNCNFGSLGWIGDVALFLIDEVHLLSDSRGAALEAIVCRMKMIARYPEMRDYAIARLRLVAVSATIPNIGDIGECSHTLFFQMQVGEDIDRLLDVVQLSG